MIGRYIFALVCALAMIAIGMGAVLEIARYRRATRPGATGGTLITVRQLRFRIVSAVLWMVILGIFAYAVTALWPMGGRSPLATLQAQRFVNAIGAALILLLAVLVLFVYDIIHLARERRVQTARFYQDFADMARNEAEQARRRREDAGQDTAGSDNSAAPAGLPPGTPPQP